MDKAYEEKTIEMSPSKILFYKIQNHQTLFCNGRHAAVLNDLVAHLNPRTQVGYA